MTGSAIENPFWPLRATRTRRPPRRWGGGRGGGGESYARVNDDIIAHAMSASACAIFPLWQRCSIRGGGEVGGEKKYVSRVLGGTLLSQDSYKNTLAADAITTIL